MRVRVEFSKKGIIKFISHRDMMRMIFRALRRTGLPVEFSEGFSPHYCVSFSEPLKTGIDSDGEWFDIWLNQPVEVAQIRDALSRCFPSGLEIIALTPIDDKAPSIGKSTSFIEYIFKIPRDLEIYSREFVERFRNPELVVRISGNQGNERQVNLAGWVKGCSLEDYNGFKAIRLEMRPVNGSFISPVYFLQILRDVAVSSDQWQITRTKTVLSPEICTNKK